MDGTLRLQNVDTKGFGKVPKAVMQDKRLSATAKAIYCYLASYAGRGHTSFPGVARIVSDLGLSKSAYYKHYNQLKEFGYIKAEQNRKDGRLSHNIYTLMREVPLFFATQNTEKQSTKIQGTVNSESNNNNFEYKQDYKNNSQSCQTKQTDSDLNINSVSLFEQVNLTRELIKDRIGYEDFSNTMPERIKLIDEIIEIILDAIFTEARYMSIDGQQKPKELVKHRLLSLNYGEVEHVVNSFLEYPNKIKKKRAFILTMLYNSKMESKSHFSNLVTANTGMQGYINAVVSEGK